MKIPLDTSSGPDLVAIARKWIGTPYMHQASLEGAGADCLGLVLGVLRQAGMTIEEDIPDYSPDWGEAGKSEFMLNAACKNFRQVEADQMQPGDILVFRWNEGLIAKHAGIVSAPDSFIHAWERAGVVENTLANHWKRRIAGVFRPQFFRKTNELASAPKSRG